MKNLFTSLLLFLISIVALAHPDKKKVEQALYNLKNVSFKALETKDDTFLAYELSVRQNIDHTDQSKGTFQQRVYYIHRGFDQPTIMETNGYGLGFGQTELTDYFQTNYLSVEHRFFGPSTPENTPYEFLTLEQATADLHEINQLFRELYQTKWISTGISKGGQTSLYYKYFYPNDVDISVPYVAPFNTSLEDPRIYSFLNDVGTKACREKIREFQFKAFKNKKAILERLTWYAKGANLNFEYIGSLEKAFEIAVLEYDFAFWQGGKDCQSIPTTNNVDKITDHLISISNVDFLSDKQMKNLASHYYQAGAQMGYYGYDITPFKKYVSFTSNPSAVYMPEGQKHVEFDDSLIRKVATWLENDANDMLFVYGGTDTWSATRVIPSNKVNSKAFVLPNKDHYQARVSNMSPEMKKEFFEAFEKITGLKPVK